MPLKSANISDAHYTELVRSLYNTFLPTMIMTIGYVGSFAVMAYETGDRILMTFVIVGAFSNAGRLAVLMDGVSDAADPRLTADRAQNLDRNFAISYYQFAAVLGLSAAYVFYGDVPRHHMLMMCLLVGYCAGAAVVVGLRPWIVIPSMIAALVPAIVMAALRWDPIYWTTAVLASAFLVGGCVSLLERFHVASAGIGNRLTFQNLARRDGLTALPNRLALREWFEANSLVGDDHELIAVHCLDLDDFKPVNDTYGHPAGDELLKTVGIRIMQTLRAGDIAARLGGDEFVVIQRSVNDAEEAAALARRLRRIIADPFVVKDATIQVATSIGFVVCHWKSGDLEELLALADEALYRAKNGGGDIASNVSLIGSVSGTIAA